MRWTGADILVQLEEGWEIDEIASATGLGIAEVKRLARDERYRIKQQEQASEVEDMEQTTRHTWQTKGRLSKHKGAPSVSAIDSRAYSKDPQWAHYEHAHPNDVEGAFSPQAKEVFRIRPGCGFGELDVETTDSFQEDEDREEEPTRAPAVNLADQAARIASLERELVAAREKILNLETCHNVARETRETWKERAETAEATLARIQESLEDTGGFAGKDTPVDARITRLVERSIRDHADLYAMQQVALEFMAKFGVSDEGWKDAEMADYVRAACQGIENHYGKQFVGVEEMREALLAVHRECERQGYGTSDKRAAVEKVHDIINYTEEVVHLAARQGQQIKELESKRELTLEQTDTPERHDLPLIVEDWERIKAHLVNGGHPAVGSCLSPTIEKLIEHSIELQDVRRLEDEEPTDTASLLDEILTAADQGNPWPVLYKAARGVGR